MYKENLLKMADYIETIPQEQFNMGTFRFNDKCVNPECNSVGCIIGHCTILDAENVINNFMKPSNIINFQAWSEEFTGIKGNNTWEYLFSSEWLTSDNTPTGAAKRIRYVVEHGLPDTFFEEMTKGKHLSYIN